MNLLSLIVKLIILIVILSGLCFGILVWKVKPLAIVVCPMCFGFQKIDSGIYAQKGMPVDTQALTKHTLALSEQRVSEFYGELQSHPSVLICATQDCITRIGGGEAASGSLGSLVLMLGPKGVHEVEISHELSLIEVARRIGMYRSIMDTIPAWYDEGVAEVVSDAPEFAAMQRDGQYGCLHMQMEDLPTNRTRWIEEADEYPFIYAQAGCRVAIWMTKHGGSHAVRRLLARIANGESFNQAYSEN
jgi:hypothetical protein